MASAEHDHVRFAQGTSFEPDHVDVDEENPNDILIHLGFLQINHVYEVQCDVHCSLVGKVVGEEQSAGHHVAVKSVEKSSQSETGSKKVQHSLTLHVSPRLEGQFLHYFHLCGKDERGSQQRVRVSVEAKVFGKNQGTPLLKDHIRLLHRLPEADDSVDTGTD